MTTNTQPTARPTVDLADQLDALRESLLGLGDERGESGRLGDCQIGQDLAVDRNLSLEEAVDKEALKRQTPDPVRG